MNQIFQGRNKAVTFSYDDGCIHDRKLLDIFHRHNIRGTFNLNSALAENAENGLDDWHIPAGELRQLYRGQEVAVHTRTHPRLELLARDEARSEIVEDRLALSILADQTVKGMAYPYGTYSDEVVQLLPECGISYSRTVASHHQFLLPDSPLTWHPTCHHDDPQLFSLFDLFLGEDSDEPRLFYVWGHSYEFDQNQNWDRIEEFCKRVAPRRDVWVATNLEILNCLPR